jgi:hypothetical protein
LEKVKSFPDSFPRIVIDDNPSARLQFGNTSWKFNKMLYTLPIDHSRHRVFPCGENLGPDKPTT